MADQQFDVFMCHNSEDKPAVIKIAKQLQQNGLKPWLDKWELPPGQNWQPALEKQIENIRAAAVFIGKQGLGPWQEEEIFAFLSEFVRRRCPVIPVLLPDAPQQPQLPIFLRNKGWVDFGEHDPDSLPPLSQLIWGITGTKPEKEKLKNVQTISQTIQDITSSKSSNKADALLRAYQEVLITTNSRSLDIELRSEASIDYRRLRELLKANQWREADKETADRMLEAVGRSQDDSIRPDELQNFPCADLKTIDALWTTYSGGKFGFSVQRKIWQEFGSPNEAGKDWDRFCAEVGWQDAIASRYMSYDELKADLKLSPAGEFPSVGYGVFWVIVGSIGGISSLACRL